MGSRTEPSILLLPSLLTQLKKPNPYLLHEFEGLPDNVRLRLLESSIADIKPQSNKIILGGIIMRFRIIGARANRDKYF